MKDRAIRVREKTKMFDQYGRVLFEVDTWIYEEAVRRGDLERWFRR